MDWNGHKQLIGAIISAFPDFHHNLEDVVAESDKVAVRFTITTTNKGEFQSLTPTGKQVPFGGMDFLTMVDGKITEERLVVDMMGWMRQLGAISTTPSHAGSIVVAWLTLDRMDQQQRSKLQLLMVHILYTNDPFSQGGSFSLLQWLNNFCIIALYW